MADCKTKKSTGGGSSGEPIQEGEWVDHPGTVYRCQVILTPEPEGGYSVVSANLPGVASQGDTEQEALENITEAFRGVLLTYASQNGGKIPWLENPLQPEHLDQIRWVFVNV
jgi:antitoxin HicB